ncbi:hypothetical protein BK011_10170 [Tenericutes bacterium MZ-XQ]|nr:hypothetical protein BK011_10170 [Tenericutes bacterium MZ-XQ]
MMTTDQVILEVKNHIGWIKLNRLSALNALSLEMIEVISNQLVKWKTNDDIYMVYLSSNHPKSFCAGGDVKSLYEHSIKGDLVYPRTYLSKQYTLDYMIQNFPKPILTFIDGYVFGGGVGLSIGASHMVVSEHVKLAMPETKIGFFPDVGASYFLNKIPHHVGRYMGILGPVLSDSDLVYLNIADYVIKHDLWENIENTLFEHPFKAIGTHEQLSMFLKLYAAQDIQTSIIETHVRSIEKVFSKDTIMDMFDSIDLDIPFEVELRSKFLEMSPTAMNFTLEMLKRTQKLSLFECFKFEQLLSEQVIHTHDFKEGVRSLLVDKDKAFDYQPKALSDVNKDEIDTLFKFDIHHPHLMDELIKDYET